MKEIKFRAWHPGQRVNGNKMNGTMLDWGKFDLKALLIDGDGKGVMQFTGLTDKNGTEMFDGDIVQGNDLVGNWRIAWGISYPGWYIRQTRNRKDWETGLGMHDQDNNTESSRPLLEVIGNIWENPELQN